MNGNVILRCANLYKTYSGFSPGEEEKFVLKNINFSLEEGSCVALVGGNGSGKTTLLKILSGTHAWESGKIFFGNITLTQNDGFDECQILRDNISLILSGEQGLESTLDTYQFIRNDFLRAGITFTEEYHAKMLSLMEELDMDPSIFFDRKIVRYSKGMKQKVHVLKALLIDKPIIFMDEPFIGLDQKSIVHLSNIITRLKGKKTFVIISHDLSHLCSITDKVYAIKEGNLVHVFDNEALFNNYVGLEITFKTDRDEDYIGNKLLSVFELMIENNTEIQDSVKHLSIKRTAEDAITVYIICSRESAEEIQKNVFSIQDEHLVNSGYAEGFSFLLLSDIVANAIN